MAQLDSSQAMEIYRECLKHSLRLISVFFGIILLVVVLFGFYIYKSFETVPQTFVATQSNSSGDNSISQGDK